MAQDEEWVDETEDNIEQDAEDLLDNDEVSAEEEGFIKGYDDDEDDSDLEEDDFDDSEDSEEEESEF